MWIDLDLSVTQERFGQLVGVGQAVVSRLIDEGVLRRGAPASAWLIAYISHLRDQASGRLEAAAVADERRRLLAARAAKAELELAEQRGQLVRASDVERATFSVNRAVRDRVTSIATRVAPIVAAETAVARCHEIIDAECLAALRDVVQVLDSDQEGPHANRS